MAENTETNCLKNKGSFEKKYQQARLCKNSSIKQATQYSLKKKKKKREKLHLYKECQLSSVLFMENSNLHT